MNKIQIHEFDPVIYPRKLWIVVTDSERILRDNFEYEGDIKDVLETSDAFVFGCQNKESLKKGVCLCFLKKSLISTKYIAHESVHVASQIFFDCNMTMGFNDGKDEHFAYLVGWIAECCEKVKLNKE